MPTRKRITSKEENFMTLSRSMVRVINNTDVPKKAKVKRKLQKNSVPNIEAENMEMDIAWWEFKPKFLLRKNNADAMEKITISFLNNLVIL